MKKTFWLIQLFSVIFLAMMVSALVYYRLNIWSYQGPDVVFKIHKGEAFSSINYRLKKQEIIGDSRLFHRYCQFKGLLTKFRAGQYLIEKDSTMLKVIDTLINGASLDEKVTIPEGKNLYEIAELLETKGILKAKEFIQKAKDPSFAKELGIKSGTFEGYLYPNTYYFAENSSPSTVIETMTKEFFLKTGDIDFKHPTLTPEEIIILASIVEKETGASWERPRIAGVFHNRLKKRMRLQSDPTTIYGIYEQYNGNIKKKHLREKTPYNTYTIPALPIGPISNPGLESIKATLNPEKHSYLYFVSKNDGTHYFSKSYKEHLKAVENWQLNKKNREGKSWRDLKEKSPTPAN